MASTVERDLATMLFNSASDSYLRERLQGIMGDKDFFASMKAYSDNFKSAKNDFESSWAELNMALKKNAFDSNDILTQLQEQVFSQVGSKAERNNLLQSFMNENGFNGELKLKLSQYFDNYENTYSLMIEGSTKLRQLGEFIRDDQLLYGLGVKEKGGVVLSLMSASSYEKFEANARNIFQLNVDENGKLTQLGVRGKGLTSDMVKGSLRENSSIMDQIFNKNLMEAKINTNGDITYQQVWDILSKSDIRYQKQIENLGYDKAKQITESRRQEILLSGKFANITSLEEAQNIINSTWGGEKGFYAENISQFAAGDVGVLGTLINDSNANNFEFQQYSIQSKFANGYFGWNGTSIESLISAFDFYSNADQMNQIIEYSINHDTKAMNSFVDDMFGTKNFNVEQWGENLGYEVVGSQLGEFTDYEVPEEGYPWEQ